MDLEGKILAVVRSTRHNEDDFRHLPQEYRANTKRYMRFTSDTADRLLAVSTVCVAASAFLPFLVGPFATTGVRLRAAALDKPDGLGFVTFLKDVEDLSDSQMKDMFGWGGLDLISRASEALAPHLQNCRAQLQSSSPSAGTIFSFDVKIDVQKPGFEVSGLLGGHESEADVAVCLRDKINSMQIADFGKLRSAKPKSYKLRLGVQLAHGADGGAP
ncbi:hypothetical protein EBR21_02025 [bacterium]|nr:hypothetical protein [bacterium]